MSPYIELVSGKFFYFLEPKEEDFVIQDIAHALANTCRFTGHCNRFYSVAEHSVHVSNLLSGTGLELDGLLHDASEAYLPDVASPIKQFLPDYNAIEDRLLKAIFSKWGLEYPFHPAVKHCDLVMLSTEAHFLLPSQGNVWDLWDYRKRPPVAAGTKPSCVEPSVAKTMFLERFYELIECKMMS
jgi:Predicted hydrolases of HD superfamily